MLSDANHKVAKEFLLPQFLIIGNEAAEFTLKDVNVTFGDFAICVYQVYLRNDNTLITHSSKGLF